jgi:2-succinyl-6-hydroxy-2,4-cyclohexadiene-1-carboxylate synthase
MAIVEIKGEPHTYELTSPVQSSTPVLVFIHGWLLSRRYWQPLLERISDRYQCLTYDLRGFGDSQKPPNPSPDPAVAQSYTLTAYAQDLKILLEQLDIQSAWLVGHSLGGSIALWGADQCPERVKGVICLNAGGGIYLREEFERFRSAGQQLVKRRPPWLSYLPGINWIFARAMVAHPLEREWGRQRVADLLRANEAAALGSLLDSTTEEEVHLLPQMVSRLQQPVYFIAGEKDQVMEPKYVTHLASFHSLFQHCGENVIEISACGHMSMVEKPDEVATVIQEILEKHSKEN